MFTFDLTSVLQVQPNSSTLMSWLHKLAPHMHREPKSIVGKAEYNKLSEYGKLSEHMMQFDSSPIQVIREIVRKRPNFPIVFSKQSAMLLTMPIPAFCFSRESLLVDGLTLPVEILLGIASLPKWSMLKG